MSGGSCISSADNVAGSLNGGSFCISKPESIICIARSYVQYRLGLNNKTDRTAGESNQIAGTQSTHRLRLALRQFALTDFFDDNEYSQSTRNQFMNLVLLANPAWDYLAKTTG